MYPTQVVKYPEYYPHLSQIVYAPKPYISTLEHHKSGTKDEYSPKIYYSKMGEDKTKYFAGPMIELVEKLKQKRLIPEKGIVTAIPCHQQDAPPSLTLIGICHELAQKFSYRYEQVLERKRTIRKSTRVETLQERYENVKDSFSVNRQLANHEKVLLIDDVKTTGISLLEATRVLLLAGASEVFPVVLGINNCGDKIEL